MDVSKIVSLLFILVIMLMINISLSLPFLGQSFSFLNSPLVNSIIKKKNISLLYDNYTDINSIDPKEKEESESLRGKLVRILVNELKYINITEENTKISGKCLGLINRTLFGYKEDGSISYLTSSYYMVKLFDDSSKNRNFLGSYDQCMQKKYKFDSLNIDKDKFSNHTFIVLTVDKTKIVSKEKDEPERKSEYETDIEFNYYLIGLCFPQGYNKDGYYCTDDEYKNLIIYINRELDNFLKIEGGKIETFSLRTNPDDNEKTSIFLKIIYMIPFILFLIQAIFVVFRRYIKNIIIHFYLKNKDNKENIEEQDNEYSIDDSIDDEDDDDRPSYLIDKDKTTPQKNNKIKIILNILNCFNFIENENELFNFTLTSTKYNNDSGLGNVRGINGVSIFFMLFGSTFMNLYNAPSKIYTPYHIENFFNEKVSVFVMIGVRYAPRIIISCSGYLLIYKYISYLDRNTINNSTRIWSSSLTFILYQSHKYILLVLVLLYQRYSLYHLFIFIGEETPSWKNYRLKILDKPSNLCFFFSFTLLKTFTPCDEEILRRGNNLLDYFWLPFNEMIFFLLGVILITIGFQKKYRIDKFILALILIVFLIKIIFSYVVHFYFKDNDLYNVKYYYPVVYYIFFNYGGFMIHPLYNLPYYLIGMYFGLVNYTIQKGIFPLNKKNKYNFEEIPSSDKKDIDNEFSNEESDKENEEEETKKELCQEVMKMPFLRGPITFVQWMRTIKLKYLVVLILIFVFIFIFGFVGIYYYVYIYYYNKYHNDDKYHNDTADFMNDVSSNFILNFVYRIDIEMVVFFVHFGAFVIFLKASNFAAIFLSHVAWTMLSKPYFSFILIYNSILLFIFYHSETLIELNIVNIILYFMIGGTITFIFTSLFYILFELPYKRVVHLIISLYNERKEKDDDNDSNSNDEDNKKSDYDEIDDEEYKEKLKSKKEE